MVMCHSGVTVVLSKSYSVVTAVFYNGVTRTLEG
jgi:hypothetical protein